MNDHDLVRPEPIPAQSAPEPVEATPEKPKPAPKKKAAK